MELSKLERLNIINQFLILEKLYPEEADYYEKHRIALQHGYTLHYSWIFENLWDDLSEADCRLVLDTLDVHRAMSFSYKKLESKTNIRETQIEFSGFDGNNESHHLAYARYFIVDLDRYAELKKNEYPDFNSHCEMIPKYKRMQSAWISLGKSYSLSEEQIKNILEA